MTGPELRLQIEQAGGLCSASDLGRRWNMSRARAHELVGYDGFPAPVGFVGGNPVWLFDEADEWRERRRAEHDRRAA